MKYIFIFKFCWLISYLLNKLFYALLTLFGVVTVIFFLFNVLPGDPAQMMLGQNEDSQQLAIIKQKYGCLLYPSDAADE